MVGCGRVVNIPRVNTMKFNVRGRRLQLMKLRKEDRARCMALPDSLLSICLQQWELGQGMESQRHWEFPGDRGSIVNYHLLEIIPPSPGTLSPRDT